MVAALLRALRAVALFLLRRHHVVHWLDTTSFLAHDGSGRAITYQLAHDSEPPAFIATSATILITWSGLLWCHNGASVAPPVRCALITCFLSTADQWLQASPAWRWETLSSPTDPTVDPEGVINPAPLLCTILHHVLRGTLATVCPKTRLIGSLHRSPPPPAAPPACVVHLYCDMLPPLFPTAGYRPLAILAKPPAHRNPELQYLHLPSDLTIVYPHTSIHAVAMRALDVIFPPAEGHLNTSLWLDPSPADPDPPGAATWDTAASSDDSDHSSFDTSSDSNGPD
jgi:hypothetical protein